MFSTAYTRILWTGVSNIMGNRFQVYLDGSDTELYVTENTEFRHYPYGSEQFSRNVENAHSIMMQGSGSIGLVNAKVRGSKIISMTLYEYRS